ncbi:MAG: tRNA lysidine(34) synthetase TilS [Parachlamydia sp.]|nr:tRNA lysidine(34) synthetase TilS [Parachlamydia sp.]
MNFLPSDHSSLEEVVAGFLHLHYDPSRPLLLALSGGPDSLALLHLLIEHRRLHPLSFGLAHVDHGWRPESGDEARLLQQMARALELPFHLKRLHPKEMQGNLEAACRDERLKFFKELCRLHNYQAVLLAHHADDQTETVLKRVLEGVSLPYLSSMRPVSVVYDVSIWRPLLHAQKSQIVSWLDSRGLKGFDDSTNLDPRFLRGKFRSRLLPLLAAEFGKEVGTSMERLADEALQLREYLDERIAPALAKMEESPSGLFLDLSLERPTHRYELRYLVRRFCEMANLTLSRDSLETAVRLILSNAADKQVETGQRLLKIDRGRLFVPSTTWRSIQDRIPLAVGELQIGGWKVGVREFSAPPTQKCVLGWRDVWRGRAEAWIPVCEGEIYEVGGVELQASYRGYAAISKWWTNAKVPAFLRQGVPVIWRGDRVVHEFLTGREEKTNVFVQKWLHVILER